MLTCTEFSCESLDGYVGIFNSITGETHLLSLLPAEILSLMKDQALTLDEISSQMAELCEMPESPEWTDRIAGMLDQLVQLELVDRLAE